MPENSIKSQKWKGTFSNTIKFSLQRDQQQFLGIHIIVSKGVRSYSNLKLKKILLKIVNISE
jgi:hypothetical protein